MRAVAVVDDKCAAVAVALAVVPCYKHGMQLCLQLQLFSIIKVAVAIGNFNWKERTTPSINLLWAVR